MVAQSLRMASGNDYSLGSASQDPFSSRLSAALEANRARSLERSTTISEPDEGRDEFENRLLALNEAAQQRRSADRAESSPQLRVASDPDESYDADPATEHSPDLQTVIDAWPTLSPAVTASILAMATAG